MTFENRIVVGLDDIKAVIFECVSCRTRMAVNPDDLRVPEKCGHCNADWRGKITITKDSASPYESFCDAVRQIRARLNSGHPEGPRRFNILLELEEQS